MDLRGKPSTFSADGTEKLVVGEEGLDGGSFVVSMTAADEGRVKVALKEDGWMKRWMDGWSGWLCESRKDNRLIRMNVR